ncbi:hypothetical protein [Micromonospora olivasterospora]|uniref:Uncharacterized protein n=1 Tax=Micromonospora olivasterospora TaxID=1880 RepID=A0A562IEB7_MICOL|nr:hypothetical protein [Micromonospora olivasterospora]TWH69053.1 hypothetical protein JD77_04055 [Micromonospora olivasterospora]
MPSTRIVVPSESRAASVPTTARARTSGRRHSQTTITTTSTSSPGPKKEFSSLGFGANSPGRWSSPSTVCRADATNEAASSRNPGASKGTPR